MGFAASALDDKRTVKVCRFELTIFPDACVIGFWHAIEAKTVFKLIDLIEQGAFEFFELHLIDAALED